MHHCVESRRGGLLVNEDRFLCVPELPLFAVLDGEVRDGHAADVAIEVLRGRLDSIAACLSGPPERAAEVLTQVIKQANRVVFEKACMTRWSGIGTTLTCFVLTHDFLVAAHVGDSRLYCCDDADWQPLTFDHSLLQDTLRTDPEADVESIRTYHANVITRIVGCSPEIEVDIVHVPRSSLSEALLCTDGFWRPLDPDLVRAPLPKLQGAALLDWAYRTYEQDGQRDNATSIVVSL
ncbi:MAG TPA: protein phosphatase 2C domain-containing protein [Polyangiaceae bacterium]|jgi:protein phosphatase|nr:protein phosphatase 2C domain-containing protein [Polyangiaceae bacterium]